ncbi:hypoxia-responsive family protein [Salix suchowensis]|nr:hypoxia-responsive family protein [Salix suchowensis]
MADAKTKVESIREWVVEHKLRTVGCLWLSGITGSVAYNWSKPNMKPSVKIIHARFIVILNYIHRNGCRGHSGIPVYII